MNKKAITATSSNDYISDWIYGLGYFVWINSLYQRRYCVDSQSINIRYGYTSRPWFDCKSSYWVLDQSVMVQERLV